MAKRMDLIARATPARLARVLDADLWRAPAPGADEQFDAERFGAWIGFLVEAGVDVAAAKLEGLDVELVIAGLSQHCLVFHQVAVSSYTTLDGEDVPGRSLHGSTCEIGGYVLQARRTTAWEEIVELLGFLDSARNEYFHRLMSGCVRLSSGRREQDGFHALLEDADQHLFDLASAREARREQQGFVTPAQAQAFLRDARALRLDGGKPVPSAIAHAYFRASGSILAMDATGRQASSDGAEGPDKPALAHAHLSFVRAYAASHPHSAEELSFLSNAVIAGGSIQGRALTIREAADGAIASCNLGLENWPAHWPEADLVTAFQVGWTILYHGVCLPTAASLIEVLARVRCIDRDIQLRLDGLRYDLMQHVRGGEPWRAAGALDTIMMLDAPAWAAVNALVAEFPVLHAAVAASPHARAISPTDFTFISRNGQIDLVRGFVASLPSVLTG